MQIKWESKLQNLLGKLWRMGKIDTQRLNPSEKEILNTVLENIKHNPIPHPNFYEYIKSGGDHCPYCKENFMTGESLIFENNEITQVTQCQECGVRWINVYKIINVRPIKD